MALNRVEDALAVGDVAVPVVGVRVISGLDGFVAEIASQVALIHAITGILIPLAISVMLTGFFGERRSFAEGLKIWPFAIYASVAMTVPYVLVAFIAGPEFPSLIGGLVGLALVMFTSSKGFLMPKETFDFGPLKPGRLPSSTASRCSSTGGASPPPPPPPPPRRS